MSFVPIPTSPPSARNNAIDWRTPFNTLGAMLDANPDDEWGVRQLLACAWQFGTAYETAGGGPLVWTWIPGTLSSQSRSGGDPPMTAVVYIALATALMRFAIGLGPPFNGRQPAAFFVGAPWSRAASLAGL